MTIFEIDSELMSLFDADGNLKEDAFERFQELQMEREQKLENIALYIKNLTHKATALKAEEVAFKERRVSCEKKIDKLEQLLSDALAGVKFETPKVSVSFRKSKKIHISDETECMEFLQINHPDCIRLSKPEISKEAVKRLLKAGTFVSGAELVESVSMGVK